jgi:glycine cleavage system H protein
MVAIFVLAVFLSVLSIDLIVLKIQGKYHPAFEPSSVQYNTPVYDGNVITIPSNLFFSKGHTWLKKNMDGLMEIGIDPFGTTALGQLSIQKCVESGKELTRGDMIFEGTYGNKVVKFLSPINGIVKSTNSDIIGNNMSNPYKSWGVRMISKDSPENSHLFFTGSEALSWMKNEFVKLKDFIDDHSPKVELAGETMYDGGVSTNDTDTLLVDKSVNDFEKEFLSL